MSQEEKLDIDWEKHAPKPPDISLNPWILENKRKEAQKVLLLKSTTRRSQLVFLFFLISFILVFFGWFALLFSFYFYPLTIVMDIIVKKKLCVSFSFKDRYSYLQGTGVLVRGILLLIVLLSFGAMVLLAFYKYPFDNQYEIKNTVTVILSSIAGILVGMYSNKTRSINFENRLM